MSETQQSPDFVDALDALIQTHLADVRVALPAKVIEYDASKQKISAQPLIRQKHVKEDATNEVERLPVITNVPVCFPGAGAYAITFPISKGDTVLLVFSDSSIDKWLSVGGDVDPNDYRKHSLSDAIAIPGLRSFKNASDQATDDRLVIVTGKHQ